MKHLLNTHTNSIIKDQQENLELNNKKNKVTDKTPETAENMCKLNKQRRKKVIRQAKTSQRQHVQPKDKSSSDEVATKTNKRRHDKQRYAICPEFQMKKVQAMKTHFAENSHYRKQKLLAAKDYYANPHIREKK